MTNFVTHRYRAHWFETSPRARALGEQAKRRTATGAELRGRGLLQLQCGLHDGLGLFGDHAAGDQSEFLAFMPNRGSQRNVGRGRRS